VELEERVVRLPGGPVSYLLRRSPRSRGIRVTIDPMRGLVVTIPTARRAWSHPDRAVTAFLADREAWIRRHLAQQAAERAALAARGPLGDGGLVRYRGELHRLRVLPASASGPRRSLVTREPADAGGDELVVRLGAVDRRPLRVVLVDALRGRARLAIEREIARHAEALGVTPARVTIRDTRTRWGSASRRGALSFSWRLVLAPPEALETVVVHELAHLRVFGHGPRFWALVASRRPDHASWRRWLRQHSLELHGTFEPSPVAMLRDLEAGS
jgi:predicted metal-dependent hydrolase